MAPPLTPEFSLSPDALCFHLFKKGRKNSKPASLLGVPGCLLAHPGQPQRLRGGCRVSLLLVAPSLLFPWQLSQPGWPRFLRTQVAGGVIRMVSAIFSFCEETLLTEECQERSCSQGTNAPCGTCVPISEQATSDATSSQLAPHSRTPLGFLGPPPSLLGRVSALIRSDTSFTNPNSSAPSWPGGQVLLVRMRRPRLGEGTEVCDWPESPSGLSESQHSSSWSHARATMRWPLSEGCVQAQPAWVHLEDVMVTMVSQPCAYRQGQLSMKG